MSRIGKLPIVIPEGVNVDISGQTVAVKGPKGSLNLKIPSGISAKIEDGVLKVENKSKEAESSALHGTMRAILSNMVLGVKEGWSRKLELVGTGYRAEVTGDTLTVTVGYSHPIKFKAPDGLGFKVEKTVITVEGPDREIVGQTAAKIRAVRPPEPYKGKGIKYVGEVIRRKAGKAAKTAA